MIKMARYRSSRVLAVYGPSTYLFLSLHFLERHTFLGPSELSCVTLLDIMRIEKSNTLWFVSFPSIFFVFLYITPRLFQRGVFNFCPVTKHLQTGMYERPIWVHEFSRKKKFLHGPIHP